VLSFRAATPDDIHTVFSDLSPVSAEEVDQDCGSWWKATSKVLQLLSIKGSQTEGLVDESGTALAIFGHYPTRNAGIRTTWFVFSNKFVARGLAATLACHKRARALQMFYPGVDFRSYTTSRHPDRSRWFSLLGFDYAGVEDGSHLYILLKSDKSSDLGVSGQYNPTHPQAS
jgi:hypothetical protein